MTLGELLGDLGRRAHRGDHLARDHDRDHPEQDDEQRADDRHGAADEVEGPLLVGEWEQVVELVGAGAGDGERGTDDDPGSRASVQVADLGECPGLAVRTGDRRAQVVGHARHPDQIRAALRGARAVGLPGEEQHLVLRRRSGTAGQRGDDRVDDAGRGRRRAAGVGRGRQALSVGESDRGLGECRALRGIEEAAGDPRQHEQAKGPDDEERQHQGRDRDSEEE